MLHSLESPWSSQSLPFGRTACVSSSTSTVTDRLRSWTNTNSFSWVSTSPLAISTTVGVLRFCTFLLFWAFFLFWSTFALMLLNWKFALLWSRLKLVSPSVLKLVKMLRQIPRCFAGASFLLQGLSMWSPRISARKNYAREAYFLSQFLILRQMFLKNLTLCYDPNLPGSRWIDFLGYDASSNTTGKYRQNLTCIVEGVIFVAFSPLSNGICEKMLALLVSVFCPVSLQSRKTLLTTVVSIWNIVQVSSTEHSPTFSST